MFPGNNVKLFPDNNARMFPGRYNARNAPMFPANNAKTFRNKSVTTFPGNNVKTFPVNSAVMFLNKFVTMFPDRSATSNQDILANFLAHIFRRVYPNNFLSEKKLCISSDEASFLLFKKNYSILGLFICSKNFRESLHLVFYKT